MRVLRRASTYTARMEIWKKDKSYSQLKQKRTIVLRTRTARNSRNSVRGASMGLAGWRGVFGGDMVGCYVFQWFIYQFVQGQMQNACWITMYCRRPSLLHAVPWPQSHACVISACRFPSLFNELLLSCYINPWLTQDNNRF